MDTLEMAELGIQKLRSEGHKVKVWARQDFRFWFEIDDCMLASENEMEELGMGVYSLGELRELYVIRKQLEDERQVED